MKLSLVLAGGCLLAGVGIASAFRSLPGRPRGVPGAGGTCTNTRRARGRPPALAAPPLAAMVNIDERFTQRDVWSMDEWATSYGVQKDDGFQLVSTEDVDVAGVGSMDYSVITQRDLPAGSPVVFVPNNMLITSSRAAEELGGGILRAGEEQLAQAGLEYQVPLFRIFVKILAEYEKGDESPYFPWLNSLPRRFNNGASMTYACFECLPPYVAWLSMNERINLSNFGKALKFVRLSKQTVKNKNLVKWAYNVAVTRSFDVGGERIIAPMADMFNHGTETEVEVNFDEGGNCVVYSTKDVPAGSPLRLSLGDPTNPSPLFATYGFLDESSPATFCKVMYLQQEMQDLGLDYSNLLFYKDTGDISPEVYDIMLYSVLSADPNLQGQFYQAYMNGDEETKAAFHQEYYQYTVDALKNHVNGFLQELDELSALVSTRDPATYPRLPIIMKHNEFVRSTFLTVKARLDSM